MYPGWPHLWHVVREHAVRGWLAGLLTLVQMAHIRPPPTLLPLPAPPPTPQGPAPTSSATSGRWGVVPGLETGGGEGQCVLLRPCRRAEGCCTPFSRSNLIGGWGCATGRWRRSVSMRTEIGRSPSRLERAGP